MSHYYSIIFENEDVLVVNKLAGIAVHPDEHHKTGTLIQEILKTHPEIKNVGDPSTSSGQENLRPGIVHRLDKDTSGVLIVAKTQLAFEYLKKQFSAPALDLYKNRKGRDFARLAEAPAKRAFGEQERKVKKTYLALVVGTLKNKTGVINLPIGRSRQSPLRRLASPKARGTLREAVTEYKVLEKFQDYTFLETYPKTGRTHQIRVHFKAIGHPLACDKLYSKKPVCPFGLSRHFLHASSIELTLPDNSRSRFEADLADDLEKVLQGLRKEK